MKTDTTNISRVLIYCALFFLIAVYILPIPVIAQTCTTTGDCPSGYRCEGGEMLGGRLRGATCVQGDIFIHVCCNAQNARMQIGGNNFWPTAQECSAVCTPEGFECRTRTCEQPPAPEGEPQQQPVLPRLQVSIPGLTPFTNPFREPTVVTEGDKRVLYIDFLAVYISAIYRYLIGIVGIVAGVTIVWAGIKWLTAGGMPDRIGSAKKQIAGAIMGLVIALGAYTILFVVNPELTRLKSLRIEVVEKIELTLDEQEEESTGVVSTAATACNTIESCRELCNRDARLWPTSGGQTIPPTEVQPIPADVPGLIAAPGVKVTANMAAALRRAAGIAQARTDGPYVLHVRSGYRPLRRQIQLVCDKLQAADNGQYDLNKIGTAIAWPGGSNHGSGKAIDLQIEKDGQPLMLSGNFDAQTQSQYRQGAELLADIMFEAGFVRYCKEIWHFELSTGSSCRSNTCRSNTPADLSC